jgi:hypothetical protein
MIAKGTKDFSSVYSSWFGKPVVMLVVIRQCHAPMPSRIVGESAADVRVRLEAGWEMNVRKDLIRAVKEVGIATQDRVPQSPKAPIIPLPATLSVGPLDKRAAENVSKALTISQQTRRLILAN